MPGGEKTKTDPRPFLDSWYDPVAQIKAYSPCFRLANLDGDGNCCLILGDQDCKLRVLQGTSIHSEHPLLDTPVSINTFYTDSKLPRTPALRVVPMSTSIVIYVPIINFLFQQLISRKKKVKSGRHWVMVPRIQKLRCKR